jgi:hypothetical protein
MLYVCCNIMTEATPPAIFNFLRKYCQQGSRMKLRGGSGIGGTVWVVQFVRHKSSKNIHLLIRHFLM